VDENQHHSYACECEQGRMVAIFQDYSGGKVIFIRYNPDSYTNSLGVKVSSDKGKEQKLLDTIKAIMNNPLDKALSVIYLFYDGYDGSVKIDELNYENNKIETRTACATALEAELTNLTI
jgi:hypothetical protein